MFASSGSPAGIEKVRQWIGNGARALVRRALAGSIEHDGIGEEETEAALALFMEAYADSRAHRGLTAASSTPPRLSATAWNGADH